MNNDLKKFLVEFENTANNNDELQKYWNNSCFTEKIMRIIEDISKKLHLKYQREYWKIDCIYYDNANKIQEKKLRFWLSEISFAIEHENFISSAFEEVNKLFLWKAKNKVLITYYSEKKYPKETHLKEWEKMINEMDNKDENFLIIFGNDDTKKYDSYYEWSNVNKKLEVYKI